MEINFEKDYLEELYENGKARSKKHRFQPSVIKKYIQTIDKLRVAKNTEELYPIKSLNYERLIGDKKGLESVRVDGKYRIEFLTTLEGEEPNSITICSIIELSNHYK
ncbi:plasmid maintenance system killer protein [Arenibacter sp. TNZ]|uniref:type II toxin-antitoxin system RelE/ParE family toxin n=1 Tax=Arenibacter TaxID=178469 RepID=UPI000CD3BDC4|nr:MULTISPECIES: type II toxin-antitoxin system RelE/ParE family toxin [Arenibacter]MCM4164025.1 plasmid maintenance system killer protein [Arenibacter sp. A80]MCM4174164.1 plasmid maintenance system killer protein [Arenibacter sp. TNZ]RFT56722.1 plasmid maintenance system killer protein [Arenibacter sp. P308M17]